ncbi:MAG: peptidyl-prolyl cis-trans isomerase [Polyangiales bacterium]
MSWKSALILAVAISPAGVACLAGCSKGTEQAPDNEEDWPRNGLTEAQANETLVQVGDRTITVGEFADRLGSQSPYLQARFESPERRREFLDNMVRFELLVYEAKRRGYAEKPEIQRARRTAMTQQLIKKEIDEKLNVTDISEEEVQAAYDANPKEYDRPAQVRASVIFVKDLTRAQQVLAQAKKADINQFRKLARERSEDPQTAADGGDLNFFTADAEGSPPTAVRDAAFTLNQVGQVFPKLVKAPQGYAIIMLTGKRAALTRTYEQAKRAIRHKLVRQKKDAAMEALLESLREDIAVEIDYDALADIEVDVPDLPR